MATKRVSSANPLPINPEDLPEDGTPVTFSQSFSRHVGVGKNADEDKLPTAGDFEDAEWDVQRQVAEGWEFAGRVQGYPEDFDLSGEFGPGKFAVTPIDPRTGRSVSKLREVRRIASAAGSSGNVLPFPNQREDLQQPQLLGGEEMPAWMRWQMEQAANERKESDKRAQKAEEKQTSFQEAMALKEFDRDERREREVRAREAKDAEASKERMAMILSIGGMIMPAITAMISRKPEAPARDVNDILLNELRMARSERTPATNGMHDSLAMVVALDKLAQSRISQDRSNDRGSDDDDDDDDGLNVKDLLKSALPMILNRGQAQPQQAQQVQPSNEMVDQLIEQALADPETIAKIAMRNPKGISNAFKSALKANPALENAMMDALDDDDNGDDD